MKAKKDKLEKKKTTMRVPSSNRDTESDSESYQSSLIDSDSKSSSSSDSGSDVEPESEHAVYEEPPPQQEIQSKKKNDRAIVGSNEPLIITQQSVAILGFSQSEDTPLTVAFENIRKRKKQQREDTNTKKRLSHINEGDELIKEAGRSTSETRMFDSFETVSLGRDDSGNVAVEGSIVVPSQPSQKEKEVLQAESEQHEKTNDAEVEGEDAAVESGDAVVEFCSKSVSDLDAGPYNLNNNLGGTTKVEPDPINIQIPVELELTLRPWLQPEAETSAAKGPIESTDEIIMHVLLSMNQEGPST
ncbi:hypothetical protein PIB30_089155 [Stylosanthes scabra]|uniref:Uncharacterized protein n=1 Tax=Stylosanthes scabra TaxID=79078 RepID=A0ABU6USR8_9FABA|nr:hypothetical protein [Stylosanthes scabra]